MADDDTTTTSTPPWGKPEDFDAERAWKLIEGLRGDLSEAKTKLADANKALGEREDADKSEAQKLADKLAAAEKRASDAAREVLVAKAQRKHNLSDEVLDFLTGDTEDEIEAKAARLATLGGKGQAPADDGNTSDSQLPGRPKAKLTPGHGGDESASPTSADLDALASHGLSRRR